MTLRGLYLGSKDGSDAVLNSSGLLGIPGLNYLFYLEQSYIESMLLFAWQTEGQDVRPLHCLVICIT